MSIGTMGHQAHRLDLRFLPSEFEQRAPEQHHETPFTTATRPRAASPSEDTRVIQLQIPEQATSDERIRKAVSQIMQNLSSPVNIGVLSAAAGISTSNFYLLFRRATGYSPLDFIIRARMRVACQLLEGTALQVKQIAFQLGYSDPLYFSRVFKAIYGVAPLNYRSNFMRERLLRVRPR